jgi:hypothetical protein
MDIFPLRCKALRCPLDLSRQNSLMRWHFKVTSRYKLHQTTKIIHSDYSITKRPITRNPQANSVQKGYTKWEHGPDPASGFLTRRREWSLEWHSCGYLVYHTSYYHTSTQAIPVQLAYLVGMPYIMFDADWKSIREHKQCKQHANNINNQRENAKRISHTYKVGDLVRSV